ncbi:MAG TPA: ion channel [Candidatus Acidoferrum sp.]|nr:ion channel [Candidatus Acidoferrum sp.]
MSNRKSSDRGWVRAFLITFGMIGLIAVASFDLSGWWFVLMLFAMVGIAVAYFHAAFPGSQFFVIALANALGVYACVFQFFVETNFRSVSVPALEIGFALPVLGFIAGAQVRRERIRQVLAISESEGGRGVARTLSWLIPVFAIGALTFLMPDLALSPRGVDRAFVGAMLAIALVVFLVSPGVSAFLIDAGLLFEEFFARISQLAAAAFAFLTFYSVIVIVFAGIYRVLDKLSAVSHFRIDGQVRDITYSESLYFSIVTMATVGYGDITPVTETARLVAAIEVVSGVLLLLFGFSEIMSYMRERRGRRDE